MASRPGFVRPPLAWFVVLDGGIVALATLSASPSAYDATAEVVPLPPRPTLQKLLAVTAALHVGEAVYARRLARRHGLPAGRWTRQTFLVGLPSTLALRALVRDR